MMNGAAISFTSKRHTTTDDSTTAAELTEQYLCSCDVEGLRQLMSEVGLHQQRPTVIWQDNMGEIQIAMNRGALAKKTRAMSMRTLSVRNKIEDGKVIPVWLKTIDMVADIGTKALDSATFVRLRDILTGYMVQDNVAVNVGNVDGEQSINMLIQHMMGNHRETKSMPPNQN